MKKPVLTIAFVFWLLAGLFTSFYFYRNASELNTKQLREKIFKMEMATKTTKDFLYYLPGLFDHIPLANVILVFNEKNRLLRGIYEPSRIEQYEYNTILKTYKTVELKNFTYTRLPFENKISVWVISRKNIGFFTVMNYFFSNNPEFILLPAAYFLIFIFFVMALFSKPYPSLITQGANDNEPQPEPEEVHHHDSLTNDRYIFNKIILLMDTIEKNFSTSNVTFYSRENNTWKYVMEKSGNLTVRGEAMSGNLPDYILNLSDDTWREPLISDDNQWMFIPLHYRNVLFGLLRLHFTGLAGPLENSQLERLVSLCNRYAHSLFIQRLYDKAVTDPESDYYNYPYFYFMVKERLEGRRKFAVAIFEVSHFNRISPESIRIWAQDLVFNLSKVRLKPSVPARLERSRFAFLFDLGDPESGKVDINNLKKIPDIIKTSLRTWWKRTVSLNGGFFIRPSAHEDTEAFMHRLEYLLINTTFSAFSSEFKENDTVFGQNKELLKNTA